MNNTDAVMLDRPAPRDEQLAPDGVQTPRTPEERPAPPQKWDLEHRRAIRKILVPTDFSTASERAVEQAVTIAHQCDATLTILHVIDINAQAEPNHCGSAQDLMKHLWGEGTARMSQLAWSLCGRVEAQTAVQEGLPWEEISEKSRDFDLVVLGEDRGKKHWNFFSKRTAQRVLSNAACPVMLVQDNRSVVSPKRLELF